MYNKGNNQERTQQNTKTYIQKGEPMMKRKGRIRGLLAALMMLGSMLPALPAHAAYGAGGNGTAVMEHLDRGIYAVKSGNGMFVSWRFNANDPDDAEFQLYRDEQLIYTSKAGQATCFLDKSGKTDSKYRVDMLSGGQVISSENCKFNSGAIYFDINLNSPGSNYSPNDCVVGDVDGDGQYEIFLKWDPNDSQDNSKSGYTSNVYIERHSGSPSSKGTYRQASHGWHPG